MKCCDWTGIFNNRKMIYNREWTNITYKIRVAKFQPNFLLAPKCLKKIRLLSGLATFSGAFSAAWGSMPSAFRCAWRPHLIIPFPPTKAVRYGPRSFAVAGPSTWNALPAGCTTTQRPTLPCHFVASWRLNYTLKHIIHTSTLVTVFTVRLGEHNFMVLTYLLTLRGHAPRRRHIAEKILYSKRVLYHNFLAPVVSKVIWGSKICIRGPAPPGRPLAEKFWHTPFPKYLPILI